MKRVLMGLFAVLVMATFVNCGKKDDGQQASANMGASCYNVQTNSATSGNRGVCNYNFSAYSGFTTFNSSSSTSYTSSWMGGTTGCSSYQVMAYSPGKGLGCVDSGRLNYNGIAARYQLDTYTNEFVLLNQTASTTYPYGTNNYNYQQYQYSSGATVVRVCDDSEPCPSGLSCRSPLGNTPTLGVCYY